MFTSAARLTAIREDKNSRQGILILFLSALDWFFVGEAPDPGGDLPPSFQEIPASFQTILKLIRKSLIFFGSIPHFMLDNLLETINIRLISD
jgi:hypothetical protein